MKEYWNKCVAARHLRYKKLYGDQVSCRKIEKELKWKVLIAGIVVVLAVVMTLAEGDRNQESGSFIEDKQGNLLRIVRPENGKEPLAFNAEVRLEKEGKPYSFQVPVIIYPIRDTPGGAEETKEQERENSEQMRLIQKEIYRMNLDAETAVLSLPGKLEDGTGITWKNQEEGMNPRWIFLTGFLLLFLYSTKDMKLKREENKARDSIIRELPEFAEKLMLLLSAGLALHGSLEKIAGDAKRLRGEDQDYFYGRYQNIVTQCLQVNIPIQEGLREFAGSSGIPEFVRLSNLISDGTKQGTDLVSRLKTERDTLWFARKKRAEERGRIAETKLTMPLVILLIVLVIITIAPTMMEI